ncbi:MAG: hypothetical protein B7X06_02475 [Verrucomicrobia bacterium 21-51-4]|nr:MAG: hypothetical protein B7X06_02475 [Verrucomicrobia bacterium 21-51-4]
MKESASKIEGVADIDFNSEYIYRGKKEAQASMNPAMRAQMPVWMGSAYAGTWMNFPVAQENVNNEIRFNTGYELPLTMLPVMSDVFTADLGYTYYWYLNNHLGMPNSGTYQPLSRSNEIYIGLLAKCIANPAAYLFYDFNLEQVVLEGSISHSFDLGELISANGFSLDLGARAGWLHANAYNGDLRPVDVNKWHNSYGYAQGDIELAYALNEVAKVGVGFHVAGNTDGTGSFTSTEGNQVIPANTGNHTAFAWWSINTSYRF